MYLFCFSFQLPDNIQIGPFLLTPFLQKKIYQEIVKLTIYGIMASDSLPLYKHHKFVSFLSYSVFSWKRVTEYQTSDKKTNMWIQWAANKLYTFAIYCQDQFQSKWTGSNNFPSNMRLVTWPDSHQKLIRGWNV